jgi:hypothetical protein
MSPSATSPATAIRTYGLSINADNDELTPAEAIAYMRLGKSAFYAWCRSLGVKTLAGGFYSIGQLRAARLREVREKGGAE